MAGHNESEKKSNDTSNIQTFNAENLQSNMKTIYYRFVLATLWAMKPLPLIWLYAYRLQEYCRTFMSIIAGVVAGILGFTSLKGFIFYFLVMAMTSVGLVAKARFSVPLYFDSWNQIVLDGFFGGLMSFVLFWTFAYDIVHIF